MVAGAHNQDGHILKARFLEGNHESERTQVDIHAQIQAFDQSRVEGVSRLDDAAESTLPLNR